MTTEPVGRPGGPGQRERACGKRREAAGFALGGYVFVPLPSYLREVAEDIEVMKGREGEREGGGGAGGNEDGTEEEVGKPASWRSTARQTSAPPVG